MKRFLKWLGVGLATIVVLAVKEEHKGASNDRAMGISEFGPEPAESWQHR